MIPLTLSQIQLSHCQVGQGAILSVPQPYLTQNQIREDLAFHKEIFYSIYKLFHKERYYNIGCLS